jgi:hypothetical protein
VRHGRKSAEGACIEFEQRSVRLRLFHCFNRSRANVIVMEGHAKRNCRY